MFGIKVRLCILGMMLCPLHESKIVKEYDLEIPQSQTAENPWHREEEPHNNHETPGRQTKQSYQLTVPH